MGLGGPERTLYSDQCMLMEEPQTATRKGIETGERSQVFDTLKKKKKKKGSVMTRCFLKRASEAANGSTCACYRGLATGCDEGQRFLQSNASTSL